MDRKTFQQGMAYLAAAYDTALSKQRLAVYWDQMRGLRDEPFMTAVKAAVGHGNRFPTVSQLREHYRDALRRQAEAPVKLSQRPAPDRSKVLTLVANLRKKLQ